MLLATARHLALATTALCVFIPVASADEIAETTEQLRERIVETLSPDEIIDAAPGSLEALLTDEERMLFSEGYVTFTVDRPVTVYIYRDHRLDAVGEPFWLEDNGFTLTDYAAEAYGQDFDVWSRDFPAGEIGLGIHALRVVREHYFISVAPQDGSGAVEIADLSPAEMGTTEVELGALTYVDRDVTLDAVSDELLGQTLIQTQSDRRPAATVYGYFHDTDYPATERPDQIALTITEDPSSSMAVQWRTDETVAAGQVAVWDAEAYNSPTRPEPRLIDAETLPVASDRVVNQPLVHRHSALIDGLEPGTAYTYAVGSDESGWSSVATFETPRDGNVATSFLYFGDVQEGFDRFESVLDAALRERPDPDFIILAGDLVSRGNDADEWDHLFAVLGDTARSIPLVPALGNHEYEPDDSAAYYLSTFRLPENGPAAIDPERAYHFTWGGNTVVVLDSNEDVSEQAEWLETVLADAGDDFTFVVSHHAAYTSRPGRYYGSVTEVLAPVIEASRKVAMVLQGHDHAYLRTFPMLDGQQTPVDDGGVYYVVSTAGDKFYDQDDHDYTEIGITETQMFQTIDIMRDDDRMIYRAFDVDGTERDTVIIE